MININIILDIREMIFTQFYIMNKFIKIFLKILNIRSIFEMILRIFVNSFNLVESKK